MLFFTPYFTYIPKAALGAVIIAAVVFMVELHVLQPMWRSKSKLVSLEFVFQIIFYDKFYFFLGTDLVPGIACFFACLILPLEMGILVGIGVNVVFILYHAARPKIHMEKRVVSNFLFVSIP